MDNEKKELTQEEKEAKVKADREKYAGSEANQQPYLMEGYDILRDVQAVS